MDVVASTVLCTSMDSQTNRDRNELRLYQLLVQNNCPGISLRSVLWKTVQRHQAFPGMPPDPAVSGSYRHQDPVSYFQQSPWKSDRGVQ